MPTRHRPGTAWSDLSSTLTWIQIRLLEKIGLAWNVRVPTATQLTRKTPADLAA